MREREKERERPEKVREKKKKKAEVGHTVLEGRDSARGHGGVAVVRR